MACLPKIRPACASDWDAVYALINELEGRPVPEPAAREVFLHNLDHPEVFYFAACENSRVVGFASLHLQRLLHHAALVGEIQELAVTAACRGRGVGSALFECVRLTAERRGCIQLEVCCNKKREQSHRFYRRQGMTGNHYKFCVQLGSLPEEP